jgi:hypothetical protein
MKLASVGEMPLEFGPALLDKSAVLDENVLPLHRMESPDFGDIA